MINYSNNKPEWIDEICATAPMQRLKGVGMNCGCEYTSFPLFKNVPGYSRYEHSIGASLIVWNFTHDKTQAIAALLHDIASPVFAHTIDFLNGDYVRQESTEDRTSEMILGSAELLAILAREGVDANAVTDYHRYPIADNDSPRLSSDRLEYTIGNAERYNIASIPRLQKLYDDLVVMDNEDGLKELAFTELSLARDFAEITLATSNIYIADEDRYAMQILSEIIQDAMKRGALSPDDLYTTEPEVINKLKSDAISSAAWDTYCKLDHMVHEESQAPIEQRRVIDAKRRYIDPLVVGKGRVSYLDPEIKKEIKDFVNRPLTNWLYACTS